MQIISNGVFKEINILKHFKISTDEYLIYSSNSSMFLGQIINNTINIPNSDKMGVIRTVISNFISNNYNELINTQNNCVILDNNIVSNLQEISAQPINFTESQLNNLINDRSTITFADVPVNNQVNVSSYQNMNANINESNKKGSKMTPILVTILLILILGLLGFMFKDKIFNNGSGSGSGGGKVKFTDKTKPSEALEQAYLVMAQNDYDGFLKMMPGALRTYYSTMITRTQFEEGIGRMFEEVGYNIKVDSNLTYTKLSNDFLEQGNKYFQKDVGSNIKMTECYQYGGSITVSGSKGSKTITGSDLEETWYCKVNGEWGFIFG